MKKLIGKKWSQLSGDVQVELMSKANVWDNVKQGECIVDFDENLSVAGYIVCNNSDDGDYDVRIDDNAILYDPTEGTIVENEKFKDLISLQDAAKLYNKQDGTLRMNIKNGFFKEWEDCIKLGTTWVFDRKALEKKYGK